MIKIENHTAGLTSLNITRFTSNLVLGLKESSVYKSSYLYPSCQYIIFDSELQIYTSILLLC